MSLKLSRVSVEWISGYCPRLSEICRFCGTATAGSMRSALSRNCKTARIPLPLCWKRSPSTVMLAAVGGQSMHADAPLLEQHRVFQSRDSEETCAFLKGKDFRFEVAPGQAGALDVRLNA